MFKALLFLSLTLSTFAEHGGTASWLKKMEDHSQQHRDLVPNTKLPHRWTEEKPILLFKATLDSSEKSYQLNLESGKIIEAAFEKDEPGSISPERFAPTPKRQPVFSEKSPDGKWQISFKKEPILTNTQTGEEKNLGAPPTGTSWNSRVQWHSDSSCFFLTHHTSHPIYQVHLVRSSPKDQVQPEHELHSYAKPGDKLNIAHPVIFFTDNRKSIPVSHALIKNPYALNDIRWHSKKHLLTLAYIERGFGKYRLIEINTDTRFQTIIVEETSDKFIYVFGNCDYRLLPDTNEILWLSERTGYNHLSLVDRKKKNAIRPLTSGNWVVRNVEALDEKSRTALIQLSGYYPKQDPYYLHYALLNLDTAKLTLLTESDGTHKLSFSPDKKHYLAEWSRVDHPPVFEVRRTSDQKLIATLNKPDLAPLRAIGWQKPERFVTKDRNGKHNIHGVIFRPLNFQKGQKYPVIENIYAGPHGSFVPKRWSSWSSHKSEMAEGGFIVVQIDGLGTNHRGRDFHQIAYKNLKDSGFPDRIKWMKAAAAKNPEMDLTRVGIYGGSAGGQSSTAALLLHGDFYKAAVSDCGCHDNRIDKMWWNEQWLDWPINDSYIQNSNRTHIKNLTGHLMLTVGEMDKNVDPSSTYQIVNDLIKADKDFTFYMIPGAGHGAGEAPHFRRKRIEFFQTHLQ
ncbi:MAG: dienelactone hydrolase [Akkermansiaceae bacterium]|jgi:dienelactone hydrolase